MEIKKFKVVTWGHWIYFAVCAFFLVGQLLAIRYNYFVKHHGLPFPAWLTMSICTVGSILISAYLFVCRRRFQKSIIFYTKEGHGVIYDKASFFQGGTNPLQNVKIKADIEAAVDWVISFWMLKGGYSEGVMRDFMNGGMLGFTDQPIDMWMHDPTGPMAIPPDLPRWAVGKTQYNWSAAMFKEGESWDLVLRRVKHEMAHECLNAVGIPPEEQHKLMNQVGFPT